MKTYEELRDEAMRIPGNDTYGKIARRTAKEYAKQWVVIAVALAGMDRTIEKNEQTIHAINRKIDEQ